MHSRFISKFFLILLVCVGISGCATPKDMLFSQGVESMTFYFGKTGAAKVAVSHTLNLDGYSFNTLTPILTEVIQNRLQARGMAAGEAKPSAGGWSQLDEFKLNGKTLILEFAWTSSGALSASGAFYGIKKKGATLTIWIPNVPALASQHYPDAESFYQGIKKDIAPIVDDALEFILNDLSAQGMPAQ